MEIYNYNDLVNTGSTDFDINSYNSIFYSGTKRLRCHKLTNIYKTLYLGSQRQVMEALSEGTEFDILVPLATLDGEVWEYINPQKTQIQYFPVTDYSILPINVLDYLVQTIITGMKKRKKIALFCVGGHGRTGYVAACVLGKLGIRNPVRVIKKNYCSEAIESLSQFYQIENYLGIDCSEYIIEKKMEDFRSFMISEIRVKLGKEEKEKNGKDDEKEDKKENAVYQYQKYSYLYDLDDDELFSLINYFRIKVPDYYKECLKRFN